MKNIPTPQRIIEIKRKRRIHTLRLVVLYFILFLSLAGALAYFSFDERININEIIVTGTSIIDPSEVISRVQEQLSGKYYYTYSRSNSFIYPQKKIYNDLLVTFPRIKNLSIIREKFNILNINIEERSGSYLYCGSSIPELQSEIGENCYFINNDGYIFDEAPYFSGNVYFKFYVKINEEVDFLGQNILESDRFHQLMRFIDRITMLGLNSVSLVINEDGVHYLYLSHSPNETTPRIIFRIDNDLGYILNNLSTAMDKSEFASEVNSKYSSLEYIDLRFKNKVLYKFSAQGGSALGGKE